MSSVLSEYPESLPAPMVGVVSPTERRKVGSIGGVQSFRTVQRDRHGTRTYAFTFTKEQAAIFREWWVEWEQRGGGWFAANWPLPWSRGPNVFRFKATPEWTLIGGGIDGQGYWRVNGSLEIRGRGMLPTVEVMYLTSTPYPIEFRDGLQAQAIKAKLDPSYNGEKDGLGTSLEVSSAYARNVIQTFSIPAEGVETNVEVLEASSRRIIQTYSIPHEGVLTSLAVFSASAKNVVITYRNYKPEGVLTSLAVLSASATRI